VGFLGPQTAFGFDLQLENEPGWNLFTPSLLLSSIFDSSLVFLGMFVKFRADSKRHGLRSAHALVVSSCFSTLWVPGQKKGRLWHVSMCFRQNEKTARLPRSTCINSSHSCRRSSVRDGVSFCFYYALKDAAYLAADKSNFFIYCVVI
jgi:hypothetical protein